MTSTPTKKDLSDIDNITDLKQEINNLRASIKLQELDLAQRVHQLPKETMKATVGAVVPSVVSKMVTGRSIGVATSVVGFLLGKRSFKRAAVKHSSSAIVKGIAAFTALKSAYAMWKNRKSRVKKSR